jgi:hypothetical protein
MESSCVDRERCRRSCGGERHTRQGDQPCGRRAASGCAAQASKIERSSLIESVADAAAVSSVTPDRATSGAVTEQRAACPAQASEIESSCVDRKSVADAAAAASALPDRAISRADTERRAACAAQASVSESSSVDRKSVADAAAAASVTPDRAISRADTENRAARAAQASESEKSSVNRERCRCSCGGKRHTRQGDQRCGRRAASGQCRPSF